MEDEDEQLIAFIKHGIPVEIIAKEMRRSDYGIICRLEKLGYDMAQYERECKQRQNQEEDIDIWSRPWNNHDDKKLIQYFRIGMSFGPLAQKINRKPKDVEERLVELGFIKPRYRIPGQERAGEPWMDEEIVLLMELVKKKHLL